MAMLKAFPWPGNVRQLENSVFRAVVLAEGDKLQPHDFPQISGTMPELPEVSAADRAQTSAPSLASAARPAGDAPVSVLNDDGELRTLEEIERDLIQFAIEVYAGHMSEVARRLGIGRSTLYRKVREHDLEVQASRSA
jgi:DNA-binding NtrC family response regulator